MARRKRRGGDDELAACYGELLELQEESGLSVARFAEHAGLTPATLYAWRRRLGRRPARQEERLATALVEVVPTEDDPRELGISGRMVLGLGRGLRVELDPDFDPKALERLLTVLARC
jgi:transposase-like protein